MKVLTQPRHSQPVRWQTAGLPALLTVLFASLASGCASPGPPRPPSLHLPQVVKDLTAVRVGDEVQLHWTTPTKTTDDLAIKGSLTAEICRDTPSAPTSPCTPVKRVAVQSGPSQASETLPRPLTLDPVALLSYRVQIFNATGHSAGLSRESFAPAGAAPPPVEQLHATPLRTGAMLEWRQQDTTAAVQLQRLIDGAVPGIKAAPRPAVKSSSRPRAQNPPQPAPAPIKPKSAAPVEIKLQTPGQATDAGGTIDRTAERGQTYQYTAQRILSVTLGGHSLELRSAVSPPITVFMRDNFPPDRPTGLAAIPGESPARSIDLSWEPNIDADLAGYIVYRQEILPSGTISGPALRLNPTPVPGPAYRDQTAMPGKTYAYRVTAVDTVGNESAPSADIQETLREQ